MYKRQGQLHWGLLPQEVDAFALMAQRNDRHMEQLSLLAGHPTRTADGTPVKLLDVYKRQAHPFGFAQGKEVFPAGTSLQIFAFPDPGYRIAEIAVICGDTVHSVKNRSSFSFSLESDSQIQVIFEKAA